MSELKGCLGWLAAIVGWFIVWGFCLSAGDDIGISPFVILLIIGGVCLIVFLIGLYIHNRQEEEREEKFEQIKRKYPLAYHQFTQRPNNHYSSYSPSKEFKKEVVSRDISIWEKEEKELSTAAEKHRIETEKKRKKMHDDAERITTVYADGFEEWKKLKKEDSSLCFITDWVILQEEDKIKTLDKYVKSERWELNQKNFAKICFDFSKEYLPKYGRYRYSIPFFKTDTKGDEIEGTYAVWQFFSKSECQENCREELDYSNTYSKKDDTLRLFGLKNRTTSIEPHIYEEIAIFIKKIAEYYPNQKISVFFNYDKDWDKETLNYYYTPLYAILSSESYKDKIRCFGTTYLDDLKNKYGADLVILPTDDLIVIFDIYTENEELKKICQKIMYFDVNNISQPVISYLSLVKAFDKEEMERLLSKQRQEWFHNFASANMRRCPDGYKAWKSSLVQNGYREEDITDQMIFDASPRIIALQSSFEREEKEIIENVKNAVAQWAHLTPDFTYKYLLRYYPVTCEFKVNDKEWEDRWKVWNFKNNKEKISEEEHDEAMSWVIDNVTNVLEKDLGRETLPHLTLVCIPASSKERTEHRFLEFSDLFCKTTGMNNAYSYMKVVQDSTPKNQGGTGKPIIEYDADFFKGKNVLLFDDIITKGFSMLRMKEKMEELGATVIAGFSIGKTFHHRPE